MRDFLASQPHVKKVYDSSVQSPRLQMYQEGRAEAAETLFIAHVPVSMVRQILDEKDLVKKGMYDDL